MNGRSEPAARGFTLIEVLVALAIVAFGLVAVFGQMNQAATAAGRLREKTLAEWIAVNQVTELRLSGQYPPVGTRSDDLEMANTRWHYEIKISETEGDYLRRADVTVSYADRKERPVATVTGFIGRPVIITGNLPGWPEFDENGELPQLGGASELPNPATNPPPVENPPPDDDVPPDAGNDSPGAEQ
jgi:general secretion pathway protein I